VQPYKLPISAAGKAEALVLYDHLKEGKATWMSLHVLMRRLWEEPELDTPDPSRSTYLISFLAAAALREDGSLMDADRLVHFITHLKYGARSFCMVEALETQSGYKSILQ
jgi:hypothetical protein